jgi:chromosome segregation ATPase
MADQNDGGAAESRLDRMEKLMELLIQDHLAFRDDLQQLLTAQVVLTDRVNQLAKSVQELRESQKDTEDRMNALIAVVDDIVRRSPPPATQR